MDALIKDQVNIDAADVYGYTPLMWACQRGNLAVVQKLTQNGANPHRRRKHGRTALMLAAQENHLAIVQYMAQQKPELLFEREDGGCSLLHFAMGSAAIDVVQWLNSTEGGNFAMDTACTSTGATPVQWLVTGFYHDRARALDGLKWAVATYTDAVLNHTNRDSETALLVAGRNGVSSTDIVIWLLTPKSEGGAGRNVADVNVDKESVVGLAVHLGNTRLLDALKKMYLDDPRRVGELRLTDLALLKRHFGLHVKEDL